MSNRSEWTEADWAAVAKARAERASVPPYDPDWPFYEQGGVLDLGIERDPSVAPPTNDLSVFFEEFTHVTEMGCSFIDFADPPCPNVPPEAS